MDFRPVSDPAQPAPTTSRPSSSTRPPAPQAALPPDAGEQRGEDPTTTSPGGPEPGPASVALDQPTAPPVVTADPNPIEPNPDADDGTTLGDLDLASTLAGRLAGSTDTPADLARLIGLGIQALLRTAAALEGLADFALVLPDAAGRPDRVVVGPRATLMGAAATVQRMPAPRPSVHQLLGQLLERWPAGAQPSGQAADQAADQAPAPAGPPRHPVALAFPVLDVRTVTHLVGTGAKLINPPTLTLGPGLDPLASLEDVVLAWDHLEPEARDQLVSELDAQPVGIQAPGDAGSPPAGSTDTPAAT